MPSSPACRLAWTLAVCAVALAAPVQAADAPASPRPAPGGAPHAEPGGLASITRDRLEGYATASGEPYSRNGLTAAHRTLPFGTLVRVTNVDNKRKVIVRINDRISAVGTRIIELTPRAAAVIGLQGIANVPVKLEVIGASGARITNPAPGDETVK